MQSQDEYRYHNVEQHLPMEGGQMNLTITQDDIDAIAAAVAEKLRTTGREEIKVNDAMDILGVSKRTLFDLVQRYPELKPGGTGSHTFSRSACVRVARLRRKD